MRRTFGNACSAGGPARSGQVNDDAPSVTYAIRSYPRREPVPVRQSAHGAERILRSSRSFAQTAPDTIKAKTDTLANLRDTLTVRPDTIATPSGIDSVVTYTAADSIVYDVARRVMHSRGKGTIDYKELGLKADQIDIHWTTSQLFARGSVDTSDTSGQKMIGDPGPH